MATTGAPGNIPLFDDDSDFAPIQAPFNAIAAALNAALATLQTQTILRYATKSDMDAVPGTVVGQHATVYADSILSNNVDYAWEGTKWVGAWTSYVPVWTSAGGSTSLGASTLTGEYRINGADIEFRIYFRLGTGSSQGSGDWRYSLPFPAAATTTRTPVSAFIENAGIGFYTGTGFIDPSGTIVSHIAMNSGAGQMAGGTGGPTWEANSVIAIQGSYRRV